MQLRTLVNFIALYALLFLGFAALALWNWRHWRKR